MPLDICPETFTRVKKRLNAVEYPGPVGLSCDDTKLLSGLRLYWDGSKKKHVLVGGTDGPIEIANPDDIEAIMNDPDIAKGTKVIQCCHSTSPTYTN